MRTFESPADYVQGRGVVRESGTYLAPLGDHVLLLADDLVMGLVADPVEESCVATGVEVTTERFGGECSAPEIDRLVAVAAECGADVVVGAGGGKAHDTAKAVADELDLAAVSLATIAASDAATSALAVIYTPDGEWTDYWFTSRHPDLVLVDTELVACAPTRYLRSGIADAVSTWFEVDASVRSDGTNMARFPGTPTALAHAIARLAYDLVREHGVAAVAAVEHDAVTASVEAVVEANLLLGGLGFENGGVAAAHSVHNGLTKLDGVHGATHGEKVNVGILTQLVLEGRADETIRSYLDFSRRLGLPVTLADIGLTDPSPDQLEAVARQTVASVPYEETIHNAFDVSWEDVRDALVTADELGNDARND